MLDSSSCCCCCSTGKDLIKSAIISSLSSGCHMSIINTIRFVLGLRLCTSWRKVSSNMKGTHLEQVVIIPGRRHGSHNFNLTLSCSSWTSNHLWVVLSNKRACASGMRVIDDADFFSGVLRLAQTPEPGLKRYFSSKMAKVLEQRNRIINPPVLQPYYSPNSLRN
jgi:hypothetical protein